jgi:hypothetical protein
MDPISRHAMTIACAAINDTAADAGRRASPPGMIT